MELQSASLLAVLASTFHGNDGARGLCAFPQLLRDPLFPRTRIQVRTNPAECLSRGPLLFCPSHATASEKSAADHYFDGGAFVAKRDALHAGGLPNHSSATSISPFSVVAAG